MSPPGDTCRAVGTFSAGGRQYQATTPPSVSPCPWGLGQHVLVNYIPGNPNNAAIDSFSLWTALIEFSLGMLVVLGVWGWIRKRPRIMDAFTWIAWLVMLPFN